MFYCRWRNTACELHGTDLNQLFDCMATVNCNENLMAVDGSRTLSLEVVALVALIKVRGRISGTKDDPDQFLQILQLRTAEGIFQVFWS